MIFLFYSIFGISKFIIDYLYIKNANNIFEEKLIGYEMEEIINFKYNNLGSILYSPLSNNKYNNLKYIGKNINIINIYINNHISFKYLDDLLKIINNKTNIILNEIDINNIYIHNNIYSNNINDIALYYANINSIIYLRSSIILNLIEYFFSTYFWTQI